VFEAWCKSSGETAWKQKGFSMAMEERGFKRKHSNVMWFLDIKLIRYVHDFVDATASGQDRPGRQRKRRQDAGDVPF
jgi:putative DNA primase/helicase